MTPGLRAMRIFAQWTDDPTECRFAFDLILDAESSQVAGEWAIFGATDVGAPAQRAFVLEADGTLNFSSDRDRRWRTDLRKRRIAVGELFSIWWTPEDRADYRIVKVASLGDKTARQSGRMDAPS